MQPRSLGEKLFRGMLLIGMVSAGSWYLVRQSRGNTMEWQRIAQGDIRNEQELLSLYPQSSVDIFAREKAVCEQALKDLEVLFKLPESEYSCATVLRYFDFITQKFSAVASAIYEMEMVHPDASVRTAAHEAAIRLQSFAIEHFSTKQIYEIFKKYVTQVAPAEALSDEERYGISETMRGFERAGLGLADEQFAQFKNLQKEAAKLGMQFETNINTDASTMIVSPEALAGCDQAFIDALQKDEQGKCVVRADTPTAMELLAFCTVTQTRKDFWKMYNTRAYPANEPVLRELLKKRQELAQMLDFPNYAAYHIADKMAKTPARVRAFLDDVAQHARKKSAAEFAAWKEVLPADFEYAPEGKIYPWDVVFIKTNYERTAFAFDDRAIAPYFSTENTLAGIFKIYQEFLGLRFEIKKSAGAWHEDVQLITVYDADATEPRGYIFIDLYPRANKFSHACHCGTVSPITEINEQGEVYNNKSVGLVIANFPKATTDRPSLLKHRDVVTFFHEFGHALHHVLGRTSLPQFSGTHVKWDFVEMPSQMFEEWMWQPSMLKMIGKHYETGEQLPDDIIEKMTKKKIYDAGYVFSRQLVFAYFSLALHEAAEHNFDALYEQLSTRYAPNIWYSSENHMYAAFGHLNSYAAGYYGYMWSLVFACDLFEHLKEHNLDAAIGSRFAHEILGKGGSVEPDVLLKNFLGREPRGDAFFRAYGLV